MLLQTFRSRLRRSISRFFKILRLKLALARVSLIRRVRLQTLGGDFRATTKVPKQTNGGSYSEIGPEGCLAMMRSTRRAAKRNGMMHTSCGGRPTGAISLRAQRIHKRHYKTISSTKKLAPPKAIKASILLSRSIPWMSTIASPQTAGIRMMSCSATITWCLALAILRYRHRALTRQCVSMMTKSSTKT